MILLTSSVINNIGITSYAAPVITMADAATTAVTLDCINDDAGVALGADAEHSTEDSTLESSEVLKPVITPLQLELAKYLKDDTICPLIRILNMMVPSALQLKTYKYLVVKDSSRIDADLIELFAGETVIVIFFDFPIPIFCPTAAL